MKMSPRKRHRLFLQCFIRRQVIPLRKKSVINDICQKSRRFGIFQYYNFNNTPFFQINIKWYISPIPENILSNLTGCQNLDSVSCLAEGSNRIRLPDRNTFFVNGIPKTLCSLFMATARSSKRQVSNETICRIFKYFISCTYRPWLIQCEVIFLIDKYLQIHYFLQSDNTCYDFNRIIKVLPLPNSLCTVREPLCASTKSREMERPKPLPCTLVPGTRK